MVEPSSTTGGRDVVGEEAGRGAEVAGERGSRVGGQGEVGQAADAGVEHAADPGRDAVALAAVEHGGGGQPAPVAGGLHAHHRAGAEVEGLLGERPAR